MKVLLITAYYKEEARAIPTSYKLARLLADSGNQVVVLTSKAISKRTYEPHKNIKVYETKDFFIKDPLNMNFMPNLFGALGNVLKKEKPDVCVISKYIFFPIFAVPYLKLKKQKVAVVTDTYPGVVWFTRSKWINFLAKMHYHTVGRFFLRNSDLVVLTHEELIDATKKLGVKQYKVIHNGVDLKKIESTKPAADIKKNTGEIIITFVGRLASIKGLDTFLAAAERIVKQHKNIRFLIVGDGDPKKFLHEANERIQFLGYRKDVVSILKKSDIFVMPSISEGLPAAVIEAMACGVPVVGSDIPGGMQVLIIDGKTGLLFKKSDSMDLEKKIEHLIQDKKLRTKLGIAAKEHIRQKFNNETIGIDWNNALKNLTIIKK